jgi:hypothetical protein
MAGGPSGTAEGVSNASMAWAMIMSAFAGGYPFPFILLTDTDIDFPI